jgi:hypothetical protein
MSTRPRLFALVVLLLLVAAPTGIAVAAPEGEMRWAIHVSLAPTWPMPGRPMGPSLAESWSASKDGHRGSEPCHTRSRASSAAAHSARPLAPA